MLSRATRFLALGLVFLGGCEIDFAFDASLEHTFEIGLGDLRGDCSGSSQSDINDWTATSTKSLQGDRCRIHSEAQGPLILTQDMRQRVVDALAEHGETLESVSASVDTIHVTVGDLTLRDAAGNLVQPPAVFDFMASISANGQALATFNGQDLAGILAGGVTFTAPQAVIDQINVALDPSSGASAPNVTGMGVSDFEVLEAERSTFMSESYSVQFLLDIDVNGTGVTTFPDL